MEARRLLLYSLLGLGDARTLRQREALLLWLDVPCQQKGRWA